MSKVPQSELSEEQLHALAALGEHDEQIVVALNAALARMNLPFVIRDFALKADAGSHPDGAPGAVTWMLPPQIPGACYCRSKDGGWYCCQGTG